MFKCGPFADTIQTETLLIIFSC